MGDNRLELRFTKEDRNKVFKHIHKTNKAFHPKKKWLVSISKLAPLTVSLLVVSLCLFLFIPSILQGNVINKNTGTDINGIASQHDEDFTALFIVKDEKNRTPLNLLFTYNKEKKMMKVLSIPRDTYAPIFKNDGTTLYDKLTLAYVYGSADDESIRKTVSKLFNLTIDYAAIMDLETFSTLIDSVKGIDYDLREDVRIRARSRVAFEFKKGMNRLNGEEVVALMMDATVGRSLGEADLINLINAVVYQTKNEIHESQLNEFTSKIEGNLPIEHLIENKIEINSLQLVPLVDGINDEMIDDAYYIKFEEDFLNSVSEELTTFN